MSLLGIDVGTTGTKAVAVNSSGQILASAYLEYSILSPSAGWFELDPQKVLSACKEVISIVAEQVRSIDPVKAIGISSQGEAFTAIDKNGKYLCNAMVSFDARSQEQVKAYINSFGAERLYHITGHSAHTLFSLFKILWLKENQPETFAKISKLMCMGDLLGFELTGRAMISYNLASRTMLFDVNKLEWSQEILTDIGLDRRVLSEAVEAGTIVGNVRAGIGSELGLSNDVCVVMGGHDQSCGAFGVGAINAGTAAYSIGTVECITPAFSTCVLDETMRLSNLATYPHVIPGLYTTVAFATTGGSGLRWFRDTLGKYEIEQSKITGQDVYELLLEDMPTEPSGLLVLPHFTSTGTPYFDSSPMGAILGLRLSTSKGELVKGLLEGITYEMKLNLETLRKAGVKVDQLLAFGGGTKSSAWLQIKADILDMPIVSVEISEAGCLGAAMLAAKAMGQVSSLRECSAGWVKVGKRYVPDEKRAKVYRERYAVYQGLYETLKPIGRNLARSMQVV